MKLSSETLNNALRIATTEILTADILQWLSFAIADNVSFLNSFGFNP